jgi:hypothetical protein
MPYDPSQQTTMVCWLQKLLQLGIVLSVLLLTGCLQYDLDIQFDSQTHGQFVQQLHWRGEPITNNRDLRQWLEVLGDRTQLVGGKTHPLNDTTWEITVPFNNGKELEAKFNQFFNPMDAEMPFTLPSGDPIRAELSLRQGNWIVAISNHLELSLDLTAVPDLTATGLPLLQSQQLLDGRIHVLAPWVRSPSGTWVTDASWSLVPGAINRIEADFWIPSPIGIGAIAIGVLMTIGYSLKYGSAFRKL